MSLLATVYSLIFNVRQFLRRFLNKIDLIHAMTIKELRICSLYRSAQSEYFLLSNGYDVTAFLVLIFKFHVICEYRARTVQHFKYHSTILIKLHQKVTYTHSVLRNVCVIRILHAGFPQNCYFTTNTLYRNKLSKFNFKA